MQMDEDENADEGEDEGLSRTIRWVAVGACTALLALRDGGVWAMEVEEEAGLSGDSVGDEVEAAETETR